MEREKKKRFFLLRDVPTSLHVARPHHTHTHSQRQREPFIDDRRNAKYFRPETTIFDTALTLKKTISQNGPFYYLSRSFFLVRLPKSREFLRVPADNGAPIDVTISDGHKRHTPSIAKKEKKKMRKNLKKKSFRQLLDFNE